MRACVIAFAVTAFAQPALARDHAHKAHRSHQIMQSHHVTHVHSYRFSQHRKFRRVARLRAVPVESGYTMPQSFARTDATDSPFNAWGATAPGFAAPGFAAPVALRRAVRAEPARSGALDAMIARHAAANGLPVELVHRVVIRESRYNPSARNGSNLGLMQIKYATARGVGYTGPASGLFDAETNLTYAVRYLAGAYRAAGGNASRAVAYYASGYHGRGSARTIMTANAAPSGTPMPPAPIALRDDMVVTVAYAPQSYRLRRR
jgi:soluble lytic murein transglycosylase-like protein